MKRFEFKRKIVKYNYTHRPFPTSGDIVAEDITQARRRLKAADVKDFTLHEVEMLPPRTSVITPNNNRHHHDYCGTV